VEALEELLDDVENIPVEADVAAAELAVVDPDEPLEPVAPPEPTDVPDVLVLPAAQPRSVAMNAATTARRGSRDPTTENATRFARWRYRRRAGPFRSSRMKIAETFR
jgi:hypothetical protein